MDIPTRWAGLLAAALLAAACSSSGDGGESADGADDGANAETTTTAPTTTAPLAAPDASVEPALLTPGDLPVDMWEWPFGTRDEYRTAPRDRARVDDLTVSTPCSEPVAAYLASTGPGPSVRELRSADGRLVIEQRVDPEPEAGARWSGVAEQFVDACGEATVTLPDGTHAEAASGNYHVVTAGVELYPLEIGGTSGGAPGLRGAVLLLRDLARTHVVSVFTTAGTDVISDDDLYDLAVHVSVPAQQKLAGMLG